MSSDKKIINWFLFGSVSTFLAFFLPAYLFAKANSYHLSIPNYVLVEIISFDLFLALSLWHGKYRADTLITDFSRPERKKIYHKITFISFYIAIFLLIVCNLSFVKLLSN